MIEIHTKSKSKYLHLGHGYPLLKVTPTGTTVVLESIIVMDGGYKGQLPYVTREERLTVFGRHNGEVRRITTTEVVFETNFRSWCRHVAQPEYFVCAQHLGEWVNNGTLNKFGATTHYSTTECCECEGTFVPFTY